MLIRRCWLAGLLLLSCSSNKTPPGSASEAVGAGAGEACARSADCGSGLRCVEWLCQRGVDASVPRPEAPLDAAARATDVSPLRDAARPSDSAPSRDVGVDAAQDSGPRGPDGSIPYDPDWRPSFEGSGGCQGAHHRDDDGNCVPDHQDRLRQEDPCWNIGQMNELGVGRPCHPEQRPCEGIEATCCVVDAKLYGAMCSMRCERSSDCGERGWCHSHKHICMPDACRYLFDVWYPANVYDGAQGFPCPMGEVNQSGVGRTCSWLGGECDSAGQATECLGQAGFAFESDQTSFCTMDCEMHADCGEGALCIYANGPPFFCAPASCADFFQGRLFSRWPRDHGAERCVEEP